MAVIAEGIETEQQYDLLKELNCQYGQGFFIAKPMDNKAIENLLESNFFKLEGDDERRDSDISLGE